MRQSLTIGFRLALTSWPASWALGFKVFKGYSSVRRPRWGNSYNVPFAIHILESSQWMEQADIEWYSLSLISNLILLKTWSEKAALLNPLKSFQEENKDYGDTVQARNGGAHLESQTQDAEAEGSSNSRSAWSTQSKVILKEWDCLRERDRQTDKRENKCRGRGCGILYNLLMENFKYTEKAAKSQFQHPPTQGRSCNPTQIQGWA